MKSSTFQKLSLNSLKLRIKSLEDIVKTKQRQRSKQQKKTKAETVECENSQTTSWTSTYEKWDEWEDMEEIDKQIQDAKETLMKLKNKTHTPHLAPSMGCCSHNRCAERKVARMTTQNRLQHMISFRKKGNHHFKQREYNLALQWYEKSTIYYEYCFPSTVQEERLINIERQWCTLNCTACFLQLKEYEKCIEYCTETLTLTQANNIKALFRRAQAYRHMNKHNEAKADLKEAKRLDHLSKGVHAKALHKEDQILAVEIEKYNCKVEKMAKAMLGIKRSTSPILEYT